MSVLIVDDEADLVDVLQFCLETRAIPCQGCTDTDAALRLVENQSIRLVVVDCRMPCGGAERFLRDLAPCDRRPRVLVHTGWSAMSTHDLMMRGAEGVLYKPYLPEVLVEAATRVLQESCPVGSSYERRCFRHEVTPRMALCLGDSSGPGLSVRNVCKGGLGIVGWRRSPSESPMSVGDTLEGQLETPRGMLRISGQVAWSRNDGDAFECGVRLDWSESRAWEPYSAFINTLWC